MFTPKTEKISKIAEGNNSIIEQLEKLLCNPTRMYIDYANVRPWCNKLGWHIDLKRLKQFLDSFDTIQAINFYNGYINGSKQSESEIEDLENKKYVVRTKPVKIMRFPIDVSSIPADSTVLLDQFIRRSLLRKYEINTIEYLNDRFKDMNKKGELYIEDRKCNFDVEISVDMLLDHEKELAETYVLWSGDSDFVDPLEKLLKAGRTCILFATTRKVSRELSGLREKGLIIFDIQKIKDFICWRREM